MNPVTKKKYYTY